MTEKIEATPHVFVFVPPYDGRCIHCGCRAYGTHSTESCKTS